MVLPPEVISTLKRSLRDDIVHICQQKLKATGNHSTSPSTSTSTLPPPTKKRTRIHEKDGHRPWLTKAARKHVVHQPLSDNSDEDADQDREDDDDGGDEPFSSEDD